MSDLSNPVNEFIRANKQVREYFDSAYEYFIKPLPNHNWSVSEFDDAYFLKFWENENVSNSVIVKDGGEPIIIRKKDYTMIAGIDCVKIAFIFRNDMER